MSETHGKWAGGLLGLHALTALHPGSGTALGSVDLPVQRERHTHWPTVAGSALKGILRDACREQVKGNYHDDGEEVAERDRKNRRRKADDDEALTTLFGPPKERASEHAGALSITDARLLAFPVRSLKGVFAWVSCPAALERLKRDADLAGQKIEWKIPQPGTDKCVTNVFGCPCAVDKSLILEEFEFETVAGADASGIGTWIAGKLLDDRDAYAATRDRFVKQFVVLHDDDFTHFARHATEVMARVGLDYDTKTVKRGALFYQEFLPAETLLYSVVLANPSRSKKSSADAAALLESLEGYVAKRGVLQVGGDETTGKGLCAARLYAREVKS